MEDEKSKDKKPKWKPLGTQVPQGSRYDPRGDTGKEYTPASKGRGTDVEGNKTMNGIVIEKKPWKKPRK